MREMDFSDKNVVNRWLGVKGMWELLQGETKQFVKRRLEGLVVPRVREGGFQPYAVGVRPRAPTPSETQQTGTSAVHGTFSYNLYTNPDMIRKYPAPLCFPDLNPVYPRLSYSVFQPVG